MVHIRKKKIIHHNSVFINAPTKAEALKKLRQYYKWAGTVKVRRWYGGKTGDKYGKNYWFDIDLTLKNVK